MNPDLIQKLQKHESEIQALERAVSEIKDNTKTTADAMIKFAAAVESTKRMGERLEKVEQSVSANNNRLTTIEAQRGMIPWLRDALVCGFGAAVVWFGFKS